MHLSYYKQYCQLYQTNLVYTAKYYLIMIGRQSFKTMFDKTANVDFLFDISKVVKHFYETPVIFFTLKDYSDTIFNVLCDMFSALKSESSVQIIDLIVDFHLQWLYVIRDIENFKKRIHDVSREEIYQAVSYTIDGMANRLKYYQNYMLKYKRTLSNEDQANLLTDMEIVEEMHKDVTLLLLEKLKCYRNFISDNEFKLKIETDLEELLHWVDKIYDGLAIQLCKHLGVNLPSLCGDLTKTLQQIVDDFRNSNSPVAQKLLDELKVKGKEISTMIRWTVGHDLEMSKVIEKIKLLEDRILRLENEPLSPAVTALKHKKEYLEKRLESLESLKITLRNIQDMTNIQLEHIDDDEICSCEDFYQRRIFNHFLPPEERERLVTELCYLWDLAVYGDRSHKSIISILSAADIKEEFTDELGTFYVDEYSRKIYKKQDDETLYQPNEHNELVPLSDDSEYVYFYDECGRYFLDPKTRQRVYKAHATASEYMMDNSGALLKIKEIRDGIVYYYDNYGRYYINDDGKQIYQEEDAASEYENDGLGNLVRIRSQLDVFELCPDDENVTEDFKYIKQSVGKALRLCIADVILHQPADPIKFLSASLIKYRENMELRERRAREKEELDVERNIRIAEERAAAEKLAMEAALFDQEGSEATYDSNLFKYNSMQPDDTMSAGLSTK